LFISVQEISTKIENTSPSPVTNPDAEIESPQQSQPTFSDASIPTRYTRIDDFSNLNQRLSSLSIKTEAKEVIVLRRKQMFAQAGELSAEAVHELVELINSFSKISSMNLQKQVPPSQHRMGNGDIVRFIRLTSTDARYLLYAISLSREMLLALVYDHNTQFSKVRRQTTQLAHELMTPQAIPVLEYRKAEYETASLPEEQPSSVIQPSPGSESPENYPPVDSTKVIPVSDTTIDSRSSPSMTSPEVIDEITPSSDLFTGIGNEAEYSAPSVDEQMSGYHDSSEIRLTEGEKTTEISSHENGLTPGEASDIADATFSFAQYITYSCLLIPRMPQHLVNSNLASYLFKWMGQLCLAFGWRLEHLSIHSDYIQWIAGAPLSTSPAFLVRTIRQKTSQYIFTQFPMLTNENPSGDFWAPGFFISGGKQTIQPHLVERYIKEIRVQQGVYNSTLYP
jgi:REP element-mobilizing transposase RayT